MNIEYIGRDAIIETPEVAFTYQVAETPREFEHIRGISNTLNWTNVNNYIDEFLVFNYGSNNDLPHLIKEVVQNNYIAPGLLKRKTELLWGLGPRLFKEEVVDNRVVRTWVDDKQVQQWLESWDYEDYLLKGCVDYQFLQGVFSKFEVNKGYKIAKPRISKLSVVKPDQARLAKYRTSESTDATHVVVTDWGFQKPSSIHNAKIYNLFEPLNPLKYPNSIMYANMSTFCTDYYTVPDIYGSLEWLNRSTAVPLIFKALSKNSINLKYHIISPQAYWDKKKEDMITNCNIKGIPFEEKMLVEFQTNYLKKISEVLSGDQNTGKYLHTTNSFTVDGSNLLEHGWEIKVIDQKISDFVEAQIKISQRADRAVASGISLHSALGNMSETGKVDSGSEQIYALISYLNTGIDIQEMIITKAINHAIKTNFPTSGLKIGFYHNVPEKQQDVSPQDRSLNNSTTKK